MRQRPLYIYYITSSGFVKRQGRGLHFSKEVKANDFRKNSVLPVGGLPYAGGGIFLLLALIEFVPVKVNPWSAIFRRIW